MLALQGLSRRWGAFFLKDITLSLDKGEYFILLGPCGAGKTLLLESICGLWRLDKGKVFINHKDVSEMPPEKRDLGLIYQEPSLFSHLSIEKNIFYGLRTKRIYIDEKRAQMISFIRHTLEIDKLIELNNPTLLSGGEKQIISIVRTLFSFPNVLLLDEPFHSLDYKYQKLLAQILKTVNDKLNLPVIHVTHRLEEARAFSSKVGFMSEGRLLKIGSFSEVKEYLKDFYGI